MGKLKDQAWLVPHAKWKGSPIGEQQGLSLVHCSSCRFLIDTWLSVPAVRERTFTQFSGMWTIFSYRLHLDLYHEIPTGPYIHGPAAVKLERTAPLGICRLAAHGNSTGEHSQVAPCFCWSISSQPLRISGKRPRNLHFQQFSSDLYVYPILNTTVRVNQLIRFDH